MKYVAYRKTWYWLSGILIGLSILSLAIWGLRFGIDFTGGSLLELSFADARPEISLLRETFDGADFTAQIQPAGERAAIVRLRSLTEGEHQQILSIMNEKFGQVDELRFDSIGPMIGKELRRTAIFGVGLLLVLICLYVAWAFRKVSGPIASWKFGFLTIFAAVHDVVIALGAFAILGHFFSWEVGSTFIAATLTILGYSINDTVVVFDRIREHLSGRVNASFEETVEMSIKQTIRRSLFTTVTTLLALVAIFLFGGDTTRSFAFALIVGLGVGAYSSIFIASPLLVTGEQWRSKKTS